MRCQPSFLAKSLLFLLAASAGANGQLFAPVPGSPFTAGLGTDGVAVGDFNGDGIPDLAAANGGSANVSVLLGNGDGTFQAATNYGTGNGPQSVVVGDFNGDGILDLAVANEISNTVTVLLGKGDGTFQPGTNFAVGGSPLSLAVGDFNGDGNLDLAMISRLCGDNGCVWILLGDGTGRFRFGSEFYAGTSVNSLAVGDFNGDGKPDLAVTNGDCNRPGDSGENIVTVLLGNGAGGFTLAWVSPALEGPVSVAVGDFNGDGKPDLAVANNGSANVSVLLGKGDGTFKPATNYVTGAGPLFVAVGNLNGEGGPDLAVANWGDGTVTVLLGDGSGGFTAAKGSAYATGGSLSVAVGYLGDGRPFIASAGGCAGCVTVLLNTGPAITANPASITFYAPVGQAAPAAIPVSVGSPVGGSTYTASSNRPWLTANPTSNATGGVTSVTLSANPASLATGTYSGTVRFTAPGFFGAATAATFNVANPSATLTPAMGSPFPAGSGPYSVAVGDFNRDGKPDLAIADQGGGVTVLLGNGAGRFTAASGSPFAAGSNLVSVAVGDFNGDGNPDLAVADYSGGVTVLLGNGSGGFKTPGTAFAAGTNPEAMVVADFNGDGKLDLAVAGLGGGVTVLLGNGSGGFGTGRSFASGAGTVFSMAVGDFNGDGKPDLAVAGYYANVVGVLLGDGSGGFITQVPLEGPLVSYYRTGRAPVFVAVADLNGDGKQDIVTANNDDYTVTVLLGDGSGGFAAAPGSPFAAGFDPNSVAVGDFNGDGTPDLAIAGDLTVTVLLGDGSGGFGTPGTSFAEEGSPFATAVGDFNGDGRPDLAITNLAGNSVTVLLGAAIINASSVLSTTVGSTITYGTAVPLTLAVSNSPGFNNPSAPTGTATFLDGGKTLGTASQTSSPYTFTALNPGAGSHTFSATYAGDATHAPSSSNAVAIQVTRVTPVITWPAPAAITYGGALGNGQLNATASVPGVFVYTPRAGTVLSVGNGQTLSVFFTPSDMVDYTTAAASTTINVNPAPPTPANLVITNVLTRSGGNVVVQLTIANTGGTAAANVVLTSVKVGADTATPLPQSIGTIGAGASAQATLSVPGSVGKPGAASSLTVGGTYTGGIFSSSARITLP